MLTVSLVDQAHRDFDTSAHRGGANVGPPWEFPDQGVLKKLQTALEKEALHERQSARRDVFLPELFFF